MVKKTGLIKEFVDDNFIKYMLDHHDRLPKNDNGLRINTNTFIEKEFNSRFKEKIKSVTIPTFTGDICHCTIYSDYKPGGIHTDGYIDHPESRPLGYTILIPLVSQYSENATIVFNECSDKAITYNEDTGLGSKGVQHYSQEKLPAGDNISKNFLKTFLPHLSIASLSLTLDSVLYWKPGSALYWPRNRFHTSAWFPEGTIRKAMVILTNE